MIAHHVWSTSGPQSPSAVIALSARVPRTLKLPALDHDGGRYDDPNKAVRKARKRYEPQPGTGAATRRAPHGIGA